MRNKSMKGRWLSVSVATLLLIGSVALADTDQGFETDVSGCDVFGGGFNAVRVTSGTNGVTSATGGWHAFAGAGVACNWGGYNCLAGCANATCAALGSPFPPFGYSTSVDIYLDVDAGYANNTRFDFSSAINQALPLGLHRRDFIFNAGFYDDTDGSPGSGTDRFVISASNNSQPGSAFAKNPAKLPIAISTTGWYTFRHDFYDSGGGVLAVDMTIWTAGGALVNSWTISDVTDIIGVTVGANRYGWFSFNQIPDLPFDNITLIGCTPSACCTDGAGTASDCITQRQDHCEAAGGLYLGDGSVCSNVADCTPLLVTFESVDVRATPDGVRVAWTTGTEIDTVGFRILRESGREKTVEFLAMVPAAGNSLTGASYEYLDTQRRAAGSVYYIEDLDTFGRLTRHGPFVVQGAQRVGGPAGPSDRGARTAR